MSHRTAFRAAVPGALILLVLAGTPAGAAGTGWEWTGGPGGGAITSLVTTPRGTLLAGFENGGLYRSLDGGLTWTQPTTGLTWPCCNYSGSSLAASQTSVFLGTWGGGVYRSDDDGDSWFATGAIPGEGYPIVRGLAVCRFGDRVYASGNFGVVRSDDQGMTWSVAGSGLPGGWCRTLALRGTTPYVLTDSGVYRLPPGATEWVPWNDGLVELNRMMSLTATADALFLSTHAGGIFRLDCDDSTWVALNADLWDDHADDLMEVDRTLYCGTMGNGVFRFDAATMAWTQSVAGLWQQDVRVMGRQGLTAWAGTYGAGLFALDPVTQTWAERNGGITAPLLTSVVVDGPWVYAGTNGGGAWRSSDYGATWTESHDGLSQLNVFRMAVSGGVVFAGTWNGVYRSTDHGATWVQSGLSTHGVMALRALEGVLYAGTWDGALWRSTNGGATWTLLGAGLPGSPLYDVCRFGAALYVALADQGVYRLADGASAWTSVNGGLPELEAHCLAVSEGALLVGLGFSGVYRMNPATSSWSASGLEHQSVFCLTPTGVGGELLAGTWGNLGRSIDGGLTWTDDNSGLKPWLAIRDLAAGNGWLYAGLEGGGVWRMAGGVTGVSLAPESPPLLSLAIEPNPFNPGAAVHFSLDRPGPVDLTVLDISGRQVATLLSEPMTAGAHQISWSGMDAQGTPVASGIYFVRMRAGGSERVAKVMRVK